MPPSPDEPIERMKATLRRLFIAPPLDEVTLLKRAWKLNAFLLAGRKLLDEGWDVISVSELTPEEEKLPLDGFLPRFCRLNRTEEETERDEQTPETLKKWAKWEKQAAKHANKTGELPTGWKWCAYEGCHGAFKPTNAKQVYCSPRCGQRQSKRAADDVRAAAQAA